MVSAAYMGFLALKMTRLKWKGLGGGLAFVFGSGETNKTVYYGGIKWNGAFW